YASHAAQLHISGTDSNNLVAFLHHQMVRQPTGFFADTAGLLETVQPVPFHEGRAGTQQTIPCLARDGGNLAHDPDCQCIAHRSDPITLPCPSKLSKTQINPPGVGAVQSYVVCWPARGSSLS